MGGAAAESSEEAGEGTDSVRQGRQECLPHRRTAAGNGRQGCLPHRSNRWFSLEEERDR